LSIFYVEENHLVEFENMAQTYLIFSGSSGSVEQSRSNNATDGTGGSKNKHSGDLNKNPKLSSEESGNRIYIRNSAMASETSQKPKI
jgi:hypothetical protein